MNSDISPNAWLLYKSQQITKMLFKSNVKLWWSWKMPVRRMVVQIWNIRDIQSVVNKFIIKYLSLKELDSLHVRRVESRAP